MRLDKFLANNTAYSRKEVKRLLRDKRITLNGSVVKSASTNLTEQDQVELDQEEVKLLGPGYFMLNKPVGTVCANSDSEHETVFDLLDEETYNGLHVAGRLDIDTTGLVLITGDGKWSHRITTPRFKCEKAYYAVLAEPVSDLSLIHISEPTRPY